MNLSNGENNVYQRILQRIIKAKATLLKESKILANVAYLAQTTINYVPQCKTACAFILKGKYYINWDATFVVNLTDKELVAVMKHECFHIIFNHLGTNSRDPHQMWNLSTDCMINQFIKNLPRGCVTIEGMKTKFNITEEILPFESSDYYFDLFMRNIPHISGEELAKMIFDDMPINMDGNGVANGIIDENTMKELSDILGGTGDASLKKKLEDFLKNGSSKPNGNKPANSKQAGNDIGSVIYRIIYAEADMLFDVLDQTLNKLLSQTRSSKKLPTRQKKNRRFGWIYPGNKREIDKKDVMVYVDASGSVDEKQLKEFFKRVNKLSNIANISVKAFDTRIGKVAYRKGMPIDLNGFGGGTSFEIVIDDFETIKNKYDGCVIFTDGCASVPNKPTFSTKVIWCLYPECSLGDGDLRSSFGHVVNMQHFKSK